MRQSLKIQSTGKKYLQYRFYFHLASFLLAPAPQGSSPVSFLLTNFSTNFELKSARRRRSDGEDQQPEDATRSPPTFSFAAEQLNTTRTGTERHSLSLLLSRLRPRHAALRLPDALLWSRDLSNSRVGSGRPLHALPSGTARVSPGPALAGEDGGEAEDSPAATPASRQLWRACWQLPAQGAQLPAVLAAAGDSFHPCS